MNETDSGSLQACLTRLVLEDCRIALSELRENPTGRTWWLRYFTCVALLRTVRDVLTKEGERHATPVHPALLAAIKSWWAKLQVTKPEEGVEREPHVYWDFINDAASSALHHYRSTAVQVHTRMAGGEMLALSETVSAQGSVMHVPYPTEIRDPGPHFLVKEGPFEGRDHIEVIDEAIKWWDDQVIQIERDARSSANTAANRL
jgi:hypothetical protein